MYGIPLLDCPGCGSFRTVDNISRDKCFVVIRDTQQMVYALDLAKPENALEHTEFKFTCNLFAYVNRIWGQSGLTESRFY